MNLLLKKFAPGVKALGWKFLSSAGALYLLTGLLLSVAVDQEKLKVKIINELCTPMDYLVLFSDGKVPFDKGRMREQLEYYEKLYEFAFDSTEINNILGFCYYYQGNTPKAIQYFQRAIKAANTFFWPRYNLGVIYYSQKNYGRAIENFQKALSSNAPMTVKIGAQSRIYKNLDEPAKNTDGLPDLLNGDIRELQKKHLEEAYSKSFEFLILSYEHTENYPAMMATAQLALDSQTPRPELFLFYLGKGAYLLKQFGAAVTVLQKCIDRNPQDSDAIYYLGLSMAALHNEPYAQIFLNRAQALKASHPAAAEEKLFLKIF